MLLTLLSESNIVGQLYFIIGPHFPLRIIFVDISGSVTGCLKIFFELNFHIVKKTIQRQGITSLQNNNQSRLLIIELLRLSILKPPWHLEGAHICNPRLAPSPLVILIDSCSAKSCKHAPMYESKILAVALFRLSKKNNNCRQSIKKLKLQILMTDFNKSCSCQ